MIRQQPIGWAPAKVALRLKRGASGVVRVALTVTRPDGTPLPSYAGWTGACAFFLEGAAAPAITLTPQVQANAPMMQLIVDLDFRTTDTRDLAAREMRGDLALTDPDGERRYPLDLTLTVDRNWTPLP